MTTNEFDYKKAAIQMAKDLKKLELYIGQYSSREMNVANALGVPGCRRLCATYDVGEEVLIAAGLMQPEESESAAF